MKATYGLRVEAWGGTSDRGRDAFCKTSLTEANGATLDGPIVFQAKFVGAANAVGSKPESAIKKATSAEMSRIKERKRQGIWQAPSTYVLITNCPMDGGLRGEIEQLVSGELEECEAIVLGSSDVASLLDGLSEIRTSFPQVLGLRDLKHLIAGSVNHGLRMRSKVFLDQAADLARVFVPTSPYYEALSALRKHSLTVLTGPPEMGKTAIAKMLCLGRAAQEWQVVDCNGPEDLFQVFEPEASQVFVADDAFGSTEYRPERAADWAEELDKVMQIIGPRHWLIWTSRPAPLSEGLRRLELTGDAEGFPDPGEVRVDSSHLSDGDKALILYRHAKAAGLEAAEKQLIRDNASSIVRNDSFTPERIRRLVQDRISDLVTQELTRGELESLIDLELVQATTQMEKSFANLDAVHQNVLVAMLDVGDALVDAATLTDRYMSMFPRARIEDVVATFNDLDNHFLRIDETDG